MKELEEELSQQILELIDEAYEIYSKESIHESLEILLGAWELIPGNKEDYEEGFLVAHEIVETYFSVQDYQEMEKWMEIYIKSDNINRNYGIAEFYAGRTAFELGKLDQAMQYFKIADKKSDRRVWKSDDVAEYYNFFTGTKE